MKTIPQPKQTAQLIQVASMHGKQVVKTITGRYVTYYIMHPAIGGSECSLVPIMRVSAKKAGEHSDKQAMVSATVTLAGRP
jgi:hypothetical protein